MCGGAYHQYFCKMKFKIAQRTNNGSNLIMRVIDYKRRLFLLFIPLQLLLLLGSVSPDEKDERIDEPEESYACIKDQICYAHNLPIYVE